MFFNPLTGKRVRLRPVWKNLWKLQILVLSRQESQRYLPMPNCKFLQIKDTTFYEPLLSVILLKAKFKSEIQIQKVFSVNDKLTMFEIAAVL